MSSFVYLDHTITVRVNWMPIIHSFRLFSHSFVRCHFLRNTTPLDQIANMGDFSSCRTAAALRKKEEDQTVKTEPQSNFDFQLMKVEKLCPTIDTHRLFWSFLSFYRASLKGLSCVARELSLNLPWQDDGFLSKCRSSGCTMPPNLKTYMPFNEPLGPNSIEKNPTEKTTEKQTEIQFWFCDMS